MLGRFGNEKFKQWFRRLTQPQAIRWVYLLIIIWAIYIYFGAQGFTWPLVVVSTLLVLGVIDEMYYL
jgi:multisubunit Na+/H+ antiporter MnhG subunit